MSQSYTGMGGGAQGLSREPARTPRRAVAPRLGSGGFKAELVHYVRLRLRLAVRVLWLVAGAALLLNVLARLGDGGGAGALLDAEVGVLLAALLIATAAYRVLARPDLSASAVGGLDAALLLMLLTVCVVNYSLDFTRGGGHGVHFLALLVVARAVVVPSTARRTWWLSLPALPAVFCVQLLRGLAGEPLPSPTSPAPLSPFDGAWWVGVAWTQVFLGFALGVATMASRVTFRLRLRAYEAQRLGPYEVEGVLGVGGMGEVYRARHALMRRPVAIKFVKPGLGSEAMLARFQDEVHATSRLTHPNTVAIYDYGTTAEGDFYYVMELLAGADLGRIVEATGPMPPGRVIHVLTQALDALAEAHAAGLIHRDIKPANLILCTRGLDHDVVKVMDFGLVKDLRRGPSSPSVIGEVVGSPETMAPETLRGEAPTAQTDLYSLGIVGCYLLTGALPFVAQTAAEFIVAHLQQAPTPPSARRADVPRDLEAILLRALAKDPDERPRTAFEMSDLLRGCREAGSWRAAQAAAWWAQHGATLEASKRPTSPPS